MLRNNDVLGAFEIFPDGVAQPDRGKTAQQVGDVDDRWSNATNPGGSDTQRYVEGRARQGTPEGSTLWLSPIPGQ